MRGLPGPRIFKRTVIPAGARAVVGGTDFRSLPQPFRGSPFFAGKRARRAGIQALGEVSGQKIRPKLKPTPSNCSGPAKPEQVSEEISYRKPDDFHRPGNDPHAMADKNTTTEWRDVRRPEFDIFISEFVAAESFQGDSDAAPRRLSVLEGIPELEIAEDVRHLGRALVDEGPVPGTQAAKRIEKETRIFSRTKTRIGKTSRLTGNPNPIRENRSDNRAFRRSESRILPNPRPNPAVVRKSVFSVLLQRHSSVKNAFRNYCPNQAPLIRFQQTRSVSVQCRGQED